MTNTNTAGADKFNPYATLERGPAVYGCVQERPAPARKPYIPASADGFNPFAPCGR